jgi:N-hydroxyarylamine O-acetyltransferase
VPFENLDISTGTLISLNPDRIFTKIVEDRRGGFCFECNGLFFFLLKELGFNVRLCSARIVVDGTPTNEFGHMIIIANLMGPILVDVGNGQSCRDPIPLNDPSPRFAEGVEYRVCPAPGEYDGKGYALELRTGNEEFRQRYLFSTQEYQLADFEDMCQYHQSSPNSLFTAGRLVTRARPGGRVTLAKNTLTTIQGNNISHREIPESEVNDLLLSTFDIGLGA